MKRRDAAVLHGSSGVLRLAALESDPRLRLVWSRLHELADDLEDHVDLGIVLGVAALERFEFPCELIVGGKELPSLTKARMISIWTATGR